MPSQDDEFLKSLQATFKVEAEEHLQAISSTLVELEKSPPEQQAAAIELIFRESHSLKGAARAVDLAEIETVCQALEGVFSGWKKQQSCGSTESFDTLHRTVDMIRAVLAAPDMGRNSGKQRQHDDLIRQLNRIELRSPAPGPRQFASPLISSAAPARIPEALVAPIAEAKPAITEAAPAQFAPPQPGDPDKGVIADTVRISIAKLDRQLLQVEDMLTVKTITSRRALELREVTARFELWHKEWARVSRNARAVRQTLERKAGTGIARHPSGGSVALADFLDWNFEYIRSLESKLVTLAAEAERDRYGVSKRVDDLLEDSKKLLMLPFSTLSGVFPKLVRDLCRDQGKEADLTIKGGDVEIDKRILEGMKDALLHVLRNCVDHGVEKPQDRARLNKPARASIMLSVTQVNGNRIEIVVSDDGAGIDVQRVKDSAIRNGILTATAAAALDDAEATALILQSGVTTSPIITEISGRGLGMAIARANAEKLEGRISIESKPGSGTILRITLPTTLATFRGILVEAGRQIFVLPTLNVDRVLRVKPDEIQSVQNRPTLSLDGRPFSLARLDAVLQLQPTPSRTDAPAHLSVVVLRAGNQQIAFVVDEVLHEEEVLVKPLGKPLMKVRNVAGSAVLGSGNVVVILNVGELIHSARNNSGGTSPAAPQAGQKAKIQRVLVVEDSITSRMLLKGILESAGYQVKTAVDGMEAFTTLRQDHFDLVVSDVEMPRMNGFDLAARIRSDSHLAAIPVVLVTALESRQERERGIDAGANAYITKSSFDQSNLLEVISKLL